MEYRIVLNRMEFRYGISKACVFQLSNPFF